MGATNRPVVLVRNPRPIFGGFLVYGEAVWTRILERERNVRNVERFSCRSSHKIHTCTSNTWNISRQYFSRIVIIDAFNQIRVQSAPFDTNVVVDDKIRGDTRAAAKVERWVRDYATIKY